MINLQKICLNLLLATGPALSFAQYTGDYQIFREVLYEKEGRIDLNVSMEELESSFDLGAQEVADSKTRLEAYAGFAKAVATVQCGHTQIHPNRAVLKEWLQARNSLPFDLILQNKKLYVNKTLPADFEGVYSNKPKRERNKKIKAFSEIISIDSLTVEKMMIQISPYLSSDEGSLNFKYYQAAQLFDFYRHLAFPFIKDSIQVQYVTGSDTLSQYFLTGTAPVHTMNARLAESGTEFKEADQSVGDFNIVRSKYAYFRFKSFKACHGKEYETFIKESFEKIHRRKLDKMIIDLRGNTGGAMQYSIMRYFVGEDVYLGRYVIELSLIHI